MRVKKFVTLSKKYSREGDSDRKCRAKKRWMQVQRKLDLGVAMWKLCREEWKSGRTSSGIHGEKKS